MLTSSKGSTLKDLKEILMPNKPSKQAVEDSIQVALDAADTATNVAEEFNGIKEQFEVVNIQAKRIYQSVSIIFISSIAAASVAILVGSLIYYKNLSTVKENSAMALEAVAILVDSMSELEAGLGLVEANLANQTEIKSILNTLEEAAVKASSDLSGAEQRYNAAIKQNILDTERLMKEFLEMGTSTNSDDVGGANAEILESLNLLKASLLPNDDPDEDNGNQVSQVPVNSTLQQIQQRIDEMIMLQKDMAAKMLEANRQSSTPKVKKTVRKVAPKPKPQTNPLQLQ